MRLLHLNEFYAPVGGLERYLVAACQALEAAGHRSSVAFAARRGDEPAAARAVYHVPELAGPATPAARRALERLLREERPDVLVVHQLLEPEVLELLTARHPSLRFAHGFKVICPGGRRMWRDGRVCQRPVGYLCQAVAYRERCMPRDPRAGLPAITRTRRLARVHRERSEIVVASGFMRQLFMRDGFLPGHVHVVPYFTELPPPGDEPRPAARGVFCAARLTREKGVDLLLEALHRLPGAALTVAGEGPERARLEALARRLGLGGRVAFVGWLDGPAVSAALERAAVVAIPSVWPEPFGIVGIEAMAHARPVVAFDVGGIREWLVPGETGLLVPPADVAGLAAAMGRLLAEPATAAGLGRQGRELAEHHFTRDVHIAALLRVATLARDRFRPAP